MARLLIAIVVGALFATGAAYATTVVLGKVANGKPSHTSLYQYGTR